MKIARKCRTKGRDIPAVSGQTAKSVVKALDKEEEKEQKYDIQFGESVPSPPKRPLSPYIFFSQTVSAFDQLTPLVAQDT